jgi:hypothetical protein
MGLLSGILGVVGGVLGLSQSSSASNDAKDAARIQAQASREGVAETRRQFDLSRGDLLPTIERGQRAGSRVEDLLSGKTDFTKTAGFQANLTAGLDAVQDSAAARSGLASGRTLKALQRTGAGIASRQRNTEIAQNLQLTRGGAGAAGTAGALGSSAARSVADLLGTGGEARASGIVSAGNLRRSGISNLFNNIPSIIKGFG